MEAFYVFKGDTTASAVPSVRPTSITVSTPPHQEMWHFDRSHTVHVAERSIRKTGASPHPRLLSLARRCLMRSTRYETHVWQVLCTTVLR